MPTEYVFQIQDWRDRLVRLSQRTYNNHVPRHPEFAEYLHEAQETIRDPDIVQESDTGATYLYRFGIGKPPFSRLYLKVVVFYVVVFYRERGGRQVGTVATYFFTDALAWDTPVIEHRAQVIGGQRYLLGEEGDIHGV